MVAVIPIIPVPESLPIPEPMTAPTEASAAPLIAKMLPLPYTAASSGTLASPLNFNTGAVPT